MERKKQAGQANPVANSALSEPASVLRPGPGAATKVDQRLADLLFDLQSDHGKDSPLSMDPGQVKATARELLHEKKADIPTLLGIMGKCAIPGCDVHTLNFTGDIIEHFESNRPTSQEFTRAREVLRSADASCVGVLVYTSGIEIIQLDGTIRAA